MNQRFRQALDRVPQQTPPIWFMRQAGRYHSHYQALRAKHSFEDLCRRPELAAQVALGPVEDFGFDVSILFSDILFPLDGLGLGLSYSDKGPKLERHLRDVRDIEGLRSWEDALTTLRFQADALKETRAVLPADRSLIGFVGGLWTLFVYAVEGGHSGSLVESKKRLPLFPLFLEKAEPLIRANIEMQLAAGAEIVMIFDTAAGEVSPGIFNQHIAPALERLCRAFPGRIGYYSKGTQAAFLAKGFSDLPWAGLGVDHRWELPTVLKASKKGFIQGNFDQGLLHLEAPLFDAELEKWLGPLKELTPQERAGWVCGLGHGVLPATPERNVRRFVERVREVFA